MRYFGNNISLNKQMDERGGWTARKHKAFSVTVGVKDVKSKGAS